MIELDFAELSVELADVADKWRPFGVQLRISNSKLHSIHNNNPSDDARLDAVLEYWMDNTPEKAPFTWETVIKALETPNVEKGRLAKKIKEKYL